MVKEIKRHNTKLTQEEYALLLIIKSELMKYDNNITLNDIVTGSIKYVHEKGITNSDIKYFINNK